MTHLTEEIEYVITTIVPATPWKAEAVLAQMAAERVTVGQGVPSQWRLLLDRPEFDDADLGALRICGTGAAPVPPSLGPGDEGAGSASRSSSATPAPRPR